MRVYRAANRLTIFFCVVVLCMGACVAQAQEQKAQSDDVIRVNTELVQTAVTVLDKQGRFVTGLSRAGSHRKRFDRWNQRNTNDRF